jgi:hypothetical protein
VYARSLCKNCYMRGRRRDNRMKLRACAVCGVSFQSVRRDALYCSLSCRQKAHRAGKVQLLPKAAHVGERGAVQSAIEAQNATLAPHIEVETYAVADLDRSQINSTIEGAANRSRTDGALLAINGHVAEPVGAETDSERAIRWLLALMMLCSDQGGVGTEPTGEQPRVGAGTLVGNGRRPLRGSKALGLRNLGCARRSR